MGLSHLEKHVAEEINSKRPVLLLVSGSSCWTQKYLDRFPRKAQRTLVPAGMVCVPTLHDTALLRSLHLPLVCSQGSGWDSSHSRLSVHVWSLRQRQVILAFIYSQWRVIGTLEFFLMKLLHTLYVLRTEHHASQRKTLS